MHVPGAIPSSSLAASRLLAMVVAANGRVDAREVAELSRLDAYRRLGIDAPVFLDMAHQEILASGAHLEGEGALRPTDRSRLLGWFDEIDDPALRLLVCRLAAAVVSADGHISRGERCLYGTMLGAWQVTPIMVAYAIMRDPGMVH